jgi:hypothetical protein
MWFPISNPCLVQTVEFAPLKNKKRRVVAPTIFYIFNKKVPYVDQSRKINFSKGSDSL